MIEYAKLEYYNIEYDNISQEFFITSKEDNRPMIGGFKKASEAIDFAELRVKQVGKEL